MIRAISANTFEASHSPYASPTGYDSPLAFTKSLPGCSPRQSRKLCGAPGWVTFGAGPSCSLIKSVEQSVSPNSVSTLRGSHGRYGRLGLIEGSFVPPSRTKVSEILMLVLRAQTSTMLTSFEGLLVFCGGRKRGAGHWAQYFPQASRNTSKRPGQKRVQNQCQICFQNRICF